MVKCRFFFIKDGTTIYQVTRTLPVIPEPGRQVTAITEEGEYVIGEAINVDLVFDNRSSSDDEYLGDLVSINVKVNLTFDKETASWLTNPKSSDF